jgi:hypothetical protein
MNKQVVIPFLPGYMFNGYSLESTGAALPPTQHIHPDTGEVIYYVRPLFAFSGPFVGMYIRHKGIIEWLQSIEGELL